MIDILYHDNLFCIVNKPSGLLVHRSELSRDSENLVDNLQIQLQRKVYPVHRLDRPTSGPIIMAFSSEITSQLQNLFSQKSIIKNYHCLVRGWTDESGVINHPMTKSAESNKEKVDAITNFTLLKKFEIPVATSSFPTTRYALLQATPVTGRMHQIRRHFAHLSHHLIGDTVYGKGIHNRLFRDKFHC
ncbi:MAG: pseudouridine synthase, partial [Lentisphaeria bacterium]